uniref:Uncharacterized protein n=1 Tax=Hemiselmis andersenii TaxID=464988 RepID=A0A7S0TWE0_HEMAN|mmetsp:Transcript_2836/g.6945  ORF Transcript_2836/g.6945 Transcript_2836/m.6945 type:complete len:148 (+) Transcript_2836:289-732(+)
MTPIHERVVSPNRLRVALALFRSPPSAARRSRSGSSSSWPAPRPAVFGYPAIRVLHSPYGFSVAPLSFGYMSVHGLGGEEGRGYTSAVARERERLLDRVGVLMDVKRQGALGAYLGGFERAHCRCVGPCLWCWPRSCSSGSRPPVHP